jgi:anti-sigma regulatory factor (Ser/Thr protein kinase)
MTSAEPTAAGSRRPSRGNAPEVVDVDQPFDADGLYAMRATVAAHATNLGAGPVLVDQLLIVASELATNAIRHGGGSGRLRVWREDARLHLEVSDRGPGMPDPTAGSKPPDQMATEGRGLWICRQLVADLRVATGLRGTTVTAVVGLDGIPPPLPGQHAGPG